MIPALLIEDLATAPRQTPPVLAGLTLSVGPGERVGILGDNGAGKSTLTRCIGGLLHPIRGTLRIAGHPSGTRAAGAHLGLLPDRPRLPPMRLGRALEIAAALAHGDPIDILPLLGLDDRRRTPLHHLSTGQARLAALALALVARPTLLVLDEPLMALDPDAAVRVRAAVDAAHAGGTAVLALAHTPTALEGIAAADHRLDAGRLAPLGDP